MVVQPSLLENVFIVVGESAWVVSTAAQLRHLVKTRNTRGLHAVTQTLNAAGNAGWITYFVLNHLWFPVATNVMLFVLTAIILGFTLSNRRQFTRGLLAIAVVGIITSIVLVRLPVSGGWLAMLYNWAASLPYLKRVLYDKKVSGLSEHSLYINIGALTSTFIYSLLIHSAPLITTCAEGLLEMLTVLRFYYRYRHRDA